MKNYLALLTLITVFFPQISNAGILDRLKEIFNEYTSDTVSYQKENQTTNSNIDFTANEALLPNNITLDIRKLLENREFEALNERLEKYLGQAFQDIAHEEDLFTAYDSFGINIPDFEELLNIWAKEYPDHYQPYAARSKYYANLGWEARGEKWASETADIQFKEMRAYFKKASLNAEKALSINNKVLPVYAVLISMSKASKDDSVADRYIVKAISINPASYYVRSAYIYSLTPRWGGSYEKMIKFARQSEVDEFRNPKLSKLKGWILRDLGRVEYRKKAYKSALKYYTKALEFGDNFAIYRLRGSTYMSLDKYGEALKDFNRAVELAPEVSDNYYWRSRALAKSDRLEDAFKDAQRALLLKPNNKYSKRQKKQFDYAFSMKAYDLMKDGEYSAAMNAIDKAILLNQDNAYNYNLRGRLYIKSNKMDLAEKDIKRAIELDPKNFSYYKLIDWILARKKAYDQVISYWDEYIKLVPNNSDAYIERGGAKYHKGDYKAAKEDAKMAMDMGHPDGEKVYNKVKGLVP